MFGLSALTFAAPWVLLALAGLPVLWWLLKLTPPAPRRIAFPAIRLLFGLRPREETPDRTPLWLILLRMVLAALVILALAHPLLNAARPIPGSGPLAVVVDDGWAAGPGWRARQTVIDRLMDEAARAERPVIVLTTAPHADGTPIAPSQPLTPEEARRQLHALAPKPWPTDRAAALAAVQAMKPQPTGMAVWISDGLLAREDDPAADLARALLDRFGSVRVYRDPAATLPVLQLPPTLSATALTLHLQRAAGGPPHAVTVRALAEDGSLISTESVPFAAGETRAEKDMALPAELRNRIVSLAIQQEESAGGVVLLDERWRTRPVGLVSGEQEDRAQPLLDDLYYLERALTPGGDVRRGDVLSLLKRGLAVLILSDVGTLTEQEQAAITPWVDQGGVLVRFAGPRLAQNADSLLPVRLRGDRTLGGAMSWERPAHLAPFPDNSPFAGLEPPPDVVVRRQVLAEPSVDLGDKTWARLEDGTPLVTAARSGRGWIVLVHTTANNDWSNLAISGLFVDMLHRLVALSEGVVGA
ncbi:MAG: BatA domain-containing protein, partial [Rhodospirillaceae bacterium]|nr:BatA domain-containing protein [Rhodospirillaceae bacterium]